MQFHCVTLFAMVPVGVSKAPVAKPAEEFFRHYDEAKKPSSNCLSALSRRDGDASDRPLGIHRKTVSRWLVQAAQSSQQAQTDRSLLLHRNR